MGGPKGAGKWGVGQNKAVWQAGGMEALEAQYTAACSHIYDGLMDLNVSSAQLLLPWQELVALRNRLLQSYGIQVPASIGMSPMAPPTGGALAAEGDIDWKSKLFTEVSKRRGKSLTKGELNFEVVEDEVAKGFRATCTATIDDLFTLASEYAGEESADSKRKAEHMAAKAALHAEFPAAAAAAMALAALGGAAWWPAAPAAAKRKAELLEADNPKGRLASMVQVLLGRNTTKGDIVYEHWAVVGESATGGGPRAAVNGAFQATVKIPGFDENSVWQGAPAPSQKAAEASAAVEAVKELTPIVTPLEAEHKAKKAKVNLQKMEEWKAKKMESKVKVEGDGAVA